MQRMQVRLDLANGQTHDQAQGRNHARQSDSDAPLTHDLFLQIHRGFMPFLTGGTPAFVETMVRYLTQWVKAWEYRSPLAPEQG